MKQKLIIFSSLLILLFGHPVYCEAGPSARTAFDNWVETFAIQRPWDALQDMPDDRRRHRGALAHVYQVLEARELPEMTVAHFYADLERLLVIENTEQIVACKPAFDDYQAFFKVDVFELCKQLIMNRSHPVRWQANFTEAYYSQADGAGMLFKVRTPPDIPNQKTYPLLVVVKKGLKIGPSAAFPFIEVKPSRGDIWGYRAMSAVDVMQTIKFMKAHYPVDPDRIYIVGFSSGASGAMHVASSYADEFAAVMPLVAVGTQYPIVNFKNLPVAMHHGTDDWTSSICNARVQYQKMKELDYPVVLEEYIGVGHSVPKPHEPIMDWMLGNVRDRSPLSVVHQCETPTLGRSYWVHIREFQDPHQRAFVDAMFTDGTVHIRSKNIQAMTLDLDLLSNGERLVEAVEIDGSRSLVERAAKRVVCRFESGRWALNLDHGFGETKRRAYQAGAAANLYEGEPLLVVFGTGSGSSERIDHLKHAARELAACGGPASYAMKQPFPVVADTALTIEQEANCNLILVGRPEENGVLRKIFSDLPIGIDQGTLTVAGRPNLSLKDQVLSLLYPHPTYPNRLVYVVAPFTDVEGLTRFNKAPRRFLAGAEGFDRVSQADLVVQNMDYQIARQMQFDKGWQFIEGLGANISIPTSLGDRDHLAAVYMTVMREQSDADFAFWWGAEDKGMWGYDFNFLKDYNAEFYSLADFRTQHDLIETMTGRVSGVELKEIWKIWGLNKELHSVPEVDLDTLKDDQIYQIHIPMDLYIKLGQRKKVLGNPKPGPNISSLDIMAKIFE